MSTHTPSLPIWRQILRTNFTDWVKLADFLQLDSVQKEQILPNPKFILNLPVRLANKIEKKSLEDPILRQFLPLRQEQLPMANFVKDPIQEENYRPTPKLLQKYPGRVLFITTGACAMHCRYCFRREFDYDTSQSNFEKEIDLISQDNSLSEVILSGGDPLTLSDQKLEELLQNLSKIPHIKKIRFHTRLPIGIPERIDDSFLNILSQTSIQYWFVIHANHPRELDTDVLQSLKKIQKLGIPILNQYVLLKGVNDSLEIQTQLCELLTNHGIFPYYLHQLDRIQGTAHFEVPEFLGKQLISTLQNHLPGYAIPKYVREIPGQLSKTPF